MLGQHLTAIDADHEVEKIFKQIDVNNTGEIDFSEFLMANIDYKKHLNEDNLKKIFNVIDTDGSKTIEINELK